MKEIYTVEEFKVKSRDVVEKNVCQTENQM